MIEKYAMMFLEATGQTLYMTFAAAFLAYIAGVPLGVWLYVSKPGGICENRALNAVIGWIVNIGRSIPFIILIVVLIPFTRLVAGTAIGATATIVPLFIGAAPFVARMVETSLEELDSGVIEAAQVMGATKWQIITKVMLVEALPSLVRGASISVVTLIGYSALAGVVGAGGLGDVAVRYGVHRYEYDVMLLTLLIIVIIVQIIQFAFNALANRIDKKNI